MKGQLWVELVGDLVIARVRGEPSEELLRECQEKVLFLVRDRLAYLARLAFAEGDYRVFYNDIVAAVTWLSEESAPRQLSRAK